jgi:hypothetical protein
MIFIRWFISISKGQQLLNVSLCKGFPASWGPQTPPNEVIWEGLRLGAVA